MDEKINRILDELAELRAGQAEIKAALASRPAVAAPSAPRSTGGGGSGVLPNYGRAKGQPIVGASIGDLEYYAAGCRRSLDNPDKAKWHAKERDLLAAIEAEIDRQNGGARAEVSGRTDAFPFGGGGAAEDDIPFSRLSSRIP